MLFRNRKTKVIYKLIRSMVINATNDRNGEAMVLYKNMETNEYYVREQGEFFIKFSKIKPKQNETENT